MYNRQLHPEEKQIIINLANGDADKERRLEAAGCALVQCAAEFAPGTADYTKYSPLQNEGASYIYEQKQLLSYNGSSFSAASYGGMVRQTSASSLFHYSADDTHADQNAAQAAMAAQRSASIDYVTLQAGAGLGGSVTINMHDGNVYAGGSVSASREKGAGVVVGMIPDNVGKTDDQKAEATDNLIKGQSLGGNTCLFGVCGGLNRSVGGQTAVDFVNVNASSWSRDLAERYRLALLNRGWAQRTSTDGDLSLCKNGVRARISLVSEVDSSRGQSREVYGFAMTYGGDTIKICRSQ
ncbi:hypothetical protein [Paraburkholderia sp. BL27I4N3]|uniref:hypothetical protein n=1 Tax=Paraburkholderia sp. BL27I4N3 TaxID=1938805 RepID=UPI000E280569|nr:hypothetical protein [Paraburkholderia sp. BL27I4N3]